MMGMRWLIALGLLATGAVAMGQTVDAAAAEAALAFLADVAAGRAWSVAALQDLVGLPGHQALIAHHRRLDPAFSEVAFLQMLLALQQGEPPPAGSPRLVRVYSAWQRAMEDVPRVQESLGTLSIPLWVDRAVDQARRMLPAHVRIEATVYLVLDGRSPAYTVDSAVVLDILSIPTGVWALGALAHEFHHLGVQSLLPHPSCDDPALDQALGLLVELVQEGSAQVLVDRRPCAASPEDFARVGDLLQDALAGPLPAAEWAGRMASLLDPLVPSLYRVGCAVIAALVRAKGMGWVVERLGHPWTLVHTYQAVVDEDELRFPPAAVAELARCGGEGRCPEWLTVRE